MKVRPALTLIELVLVMGLIAVLTVPFVISFTGFRERHSLKSTGENMANMIRTTRVYAREERNEASWGIRYANDKSYSIISGTPLSFTVTGSYVLDTPVKFEESFPDIWFRQSSGETDKKYSIKLVTTSGVAASVDISKAGIVKYIGP